MFTWSDLKQAADFVKATYPHRATRNLLEARLAFTKLARLNKPFDEYKTQQEVADSLKVISADRVNYKTNRIEAKAKMGEFHKIANITLATFHDDLDMALRFTFARLWKWIQFKAKNPNTVIKKTTRILEFTMNLGKRRISPVPRSSHICEAAEQPQGSLLRPDGNKTCQR